MYQLFNTRMIKVLKSEKEYEEALERAEMYFANPPKMGSLEGDQFELLLLVIKEYEDRYYPIPVLDAIEAIKITMEEKGLKIKDMQPYMGSKSYVSQVLNRKKPLTLEMVKNLHSAFHIPFKMLLA